MKNIARFLVLFAAINIALSAAEKKPLTNADVLKMVRAELPESTIILAIQNSASQFDSAPEALIELKSAGVSTKVIEAMLTPRAQTTAAVEVAVAAPTPARTQTATSSPPPLALGGLSALWGTKQTRIDADRVFLFEGDKRTEMKFTKPNTRTRLIYGFQQFAVLGGLKARLRTTTRAPEFEMILPNNVEISSVLGLALLGERSNGSREILIGGGFLTMSQGLPKDRNIAITYEKGVDQSQAPEGYDLYRIRPAAALKPGEYALMVSKPGGGEMGALAGANFNYNFYELGVD